MIKPYRGRRRRLRCGGMMLSALILVLFLFSGVAAFRPQAFKALFGESVAAYPELDSRGDYIRRVIEIEESRKRRCGTNTDDINMFHQNIVE